MNLGAAPLCGCSNSHPHAADSGESRPVAASPQRSIPPGTVANHRSERAGGTTPGVVLDPFGGVA